MIKHWDKIAGLNADSVSKGLFFSCAIQEVSKMHYSNQMKFYTALSFFFVTLGSVGQLQGSVVAGQATNLVLFCFLFCKRIIDLPGVEGKLITPGLGDTFLFRSSPS